MRHLEIFRHRTDVTLTLWCRPRLRWSQPPKFFIWVSCGEYARQAERCLKQQLFAHVRSERLVYIYADIYLLYTLWTWCARVVE